MVNILITPSGKLYGSENVLYDYLIHSKLEFDFIFVPESSPFQKKLEQINLRTKSFNNVKHLYFKLFFKLLTSKVKFVYCNEAGHIRYIYLLTKVFPQTMFIVHVRILEDTHRIRLSKHNLKVITISQTIQNEVKIANHLVYDGYHFNEIRNWQLPNSSKLRVGVVGRLTTSKGIEFFTETFFQNCGSRIEFYFYGDIDCMSEKSDIINRLKIRNNVYLEGFVKDKNQIYSSVDILLHVNENEPLGRIFFESLDYGTPFIGINKGGIAEIAKQINYPYVLEKNQLAQALLRISFNKWTFDIQKLEDSRNYAMDFFSCEKYTSRIDNLLT
jgi:glycosyltransferase involved in cell wall biosynthesis